MKIEFYENEIIVYLTKEYETIKDIKNIDEVEDYFKNLLIKIKKRYDFESFGYYNVYVYIDESYGMVIEFHKLDSDIFFVPDEVIDLKITFITDAIFYLVVKDKNLLKDKKYTEKEDGYYVIYKDVDKSLIEQGILVYKKQDPY